MILYKKNLIIASSLFKKEERTGPIKIWSRKSLIPSSLLDKRVLIHTGSHFKKELITINHIGYKFGEFAPTRKNGKKKNG
jgi:small subunit ribosomal protein S19